MFFTVKHLSVCKHFTQRFFMIHFWNGVLSIDKIVSFYNGYSSSIRVLFSTSYGLTPLDKSVYYMYFTGPWCVCWAAFSWIRLTNSCFSKQPWHSSPHDDKIFFNSETLRFLSPSLLKSFRLRSVNSNHNAHDKYKPCFHTFHILYTLRQI